MSNFLEDGAALSITQVLKAAKEFPSFMKYLKLVNDELEFFQKCIGKPFSSSAINFKPTLYSDLYSRYSLHFWKHFSSLEATSLNIF